MTDKKLRKLAEEAIILARLGDFLKYEVGLRINLSIGELKKIIRIIRKR